MINSNKCMYSYLVSEKRAYLPVLSLGELFQKSNLSIPTNLRKWFEKNKRDGKIMTHADVANKFYESHGDIGMNTNDIFKE